MGEIDVFSSNNLSAELEHVYLNDTARPYGRILTFPNSTCQTNKSKRLLRLKKLTEPMS